MKHPAHRREMNGNEHGVDGLTTIEEKFVACLATGYTRRQAAIEAHPQRKESVKAYDSWACRAMGRARVTRKLHALVAGKKVEDIYSPARWALDVLADVERAIERGNETAVNASRRMLAQSLGMLKDRVIVSGEHAMSDAELVTALSGTDKAKAATLSVVMGDGTFRKAA